MLMLMLMLTTFTLTLKNQIDHKDRQSASLPRC